MTTLMRGLGRGLVGVFLSFTLAAAAPGAAPIPAATPAPTAVGGDFRLTDHLGRDFRLRDLRGKVVLIFFGYTTCPDVCPMELSSMAATLRKLGPESVQGLFITVDPERDTPEQLKSYVSFFHPNLLGLTGTPEDIRRVAGSYHVNYRKVGEGEYYTMDHSSHLFILNTHGKLQSIAPFGVPDWYIVEVVDQILKEP